jgi:hypothetical protein
MKLFELDGEFSFSKFLRKIFQHLPITTMHFFYLSDYFKAVVKTPSTHLPFKYLPNNL